MTIMVGDQLTQIGSFYPMVSWRSSSWITRHLYGTTISKILVREELIKASGSKQVISLIRKITIELKHHLKERLLQRKSDGEELVQLPFRMAPNIKDRLKMDNSTAGED